MQKYTIHVTTNSDDAFSADIQYTDTEKDIDVAVSGDGTYDELLETMFEMASALKDEVDTCNEKTEIDLLLEGDEDTLANNILDLYDKNILLENKIEELERQLAEKDIILENLPGNTCSEEGCSCKAKKNDSTIDKYDDLVKRLNSIKVAMPGVERYVDRLADLVNYYL